MKLLQIMNEATMIKTLKILNAKISAGKALSERSLSPLELISVRWWDD